MSHGQPPPDRQASASQRVRPFRHGGAAPERGSSVLDRRQVLRLMGGVAAAGAVAAASGCSSHLAPTQLERPLGRTITVGLLTPSQGVFAAMGDDIGQGFKLFLEDNDNLLGLHHVDLRIADEGVTPEAAVLAVKGLLNQGITALVGVANPAALAALVPVLAQAQVPLVSTSVAPSSLSPTPFLWRVSSVEGEAGRSLAPYVFQNAPRLYVLSEDTSAAKEEVTAFRKALSELGGPGIVVGESPPGGALSFAARFQAARAAKATMIFAAYSGAEAVAFLLAYLDVARDLKLVGPGSLTDSMNLIGKLTDLKQVYTSLFYAADLDNEPNRRFVSRYFKLYGHQPNGYALAAYDSATVLSKALRLVGGTLDGPSLNTAIGQLGQIDSPRGTWIFNEHHGPQQRWYLRQLRPDGQVLANSLDTELQVLG